MIKSTFQILLVSFVTTLTPIRASAEDKIPDIKAELVKSVGQSPNETIVGIHFIMQPGWHIYWKEPGDSGLPTRVNFLRDGKKVDAELFWPKHEVFSQSDGLSTNGYSKEVVLFSKISTEGSDEISADVKWLGCSHDLCVPGKAKLQANLKTLNNSDLSQWVSAVPN